MPQSITTLKYWSSACPLIQLFTWLLLLHCPQRAVCVHASWRLVYFQYFSFSCNSDLNPSAAALQSNYKPFSQMFISETKRKADLDFEVCSLKVLAKEEKPSGMCWTCSPLHIEHLTHAGRDMKGRIWSMCRGCWQEKRKKPPFRETLDQLQPIPVIKGCEGLWWLVNSVVLGEWYSFWDRADRWSDAK